MWPDPPGRNWFESTGSSARTRTVVDLAGVYGEDGLREMFERAAAGGKLELAAIQAVLDGGPKRRGAPCLRRVIEEWRPVAETAKYATVRSLFEAKLLPLIARSGLPIPRINAPVRTAARVLEVDLLWPDERFVVEADSRLHHATEVAFERDRKRDLDLLEVHYEVLRVTWKQVEHEPQRVFAVIRSELERRAKAAERRTGQSGAARPGATRWKDASDLAPRRAPPLPLHPRPPAAS
jgi:very-short-patch-repair endonuclease